MLCFYFIVRARIFTYKLQNDIIIFMESFETILNNIARVKAELDSAKTSDVTEVGLVLATKTVPRQLLERLADYDKFIFGENRVQEFTDKYFEHKNIEWHFIGQLQSNKVKYIIDKVALIHSVDRLSLAAEINYRAAKIGKIVDVLIEINVAGEELKGGIAVNCAEKFIKDLDAYPNIRIKGLMSVMPNIETKALEKYYLQLKDLYDTIKKDAPDKMRYLSLGMSGDYRLAVTNGSNMVRLGSAVFGARDGGIYDKR